MGVRMAVLSPAPPRTMACRGAKSSVLWTITVRTRLLRGKCPILEGKHGIEPYVLGIVLAIYLAAVSGRPDIVGQDRTGQGFRLRISAHRIGSQIFEKFLPTGTPIVIDAQQFRGPQGQRHRATDRRQIHDAVVNTPEVFMHVCAVDVIPAVLSQLDHLSIELERSRATADTRVNAAMPSSPVWRNRHQACTASSAPDEHTWLIATVVGAAELGLSMMVFVDGEHVTTVDLQMDGGGRGPDQCSHDAIADRLTFDRLCRGTVIYQVAAGHERAIVRLNPVGWFFGTFCEREVDKGAFRGSRAGRADPAGIASLGDVLQSQ